MTGPEEHGVPCMLLRGGTSKGAFFLASDLPTDPAARDDLLLRVMGSPDPRQIDGIGGATPLTSKVAVVSASAETGVALDYLFLQVVVEEPVVSTRQTCGNLLAGVAPFAIERGLVAAEDPATTVRIRLLNTGDLATATVRTSGGRVDYAGATTAGRADGDPGAVAIPGVPGIAAPVELEVRSGSPLLPTGRVTDDVTGRTVTLVDNGMPVVLVRAGELGVDGAEEPAVLEGNRALTAAVEELRLAAGPLMGLGDVRGQTVPKVFLLSPGRDGGAVCTRAFIPDRVHTSIGVLMAASVAAGVRLPGAVGHDLLPPTRNPEDPILIEHPAGTYRAQVSVERREDGSWRASSTSTRTARKLFDGRVFPRPAGPATLTGTPTTER